MKNVPLMVTAAFIAETISRSLYKDAFACLMEIIRNGLCASMPGKSWVAGKGQINIDLCRHPLANGPVLTILDHGRGFDRRSMELMGSLGRTMSEKEMYPDGNFDGASQKGIGRFAALGCMNVEDSRKLDPYTGFYILTRDKDTGPINLISMIPSLMEQHQGTPIEELALTDKRLGSTARLKGTFAMVIIPNPIFPDANNILEGIKWRLPRKSEQMFALTINGQRVTPPPLAGRVHFLSEDGEIEVHADVEPDPDSDTGIWFTDATTGFRVVLASRLGRTHVPPPYCYNGLTGDIFIQGLLKRQNASRGGLSADYLRSEDWRKVKASLYANRPSVEALLGHQRTRDVQGDKEVNDLIALAAAIFGPSQVVRNEDGTVEKKKAQEETPKPNSNRELGRRLKQGTHAPRKGGEPRRGGHNVRAIRLGEHDYLIDTQRLKSHRYAEAAGTRLNDDDEEVITILVNDLYEHLPTRAEARSEHVTNAFLFAAACANPDLANRAPEAMDQVILWKSKLFPGK